MTIILFIFIGLVFLAGLYFLFNFLFKISILLLALLVTFGVIQDKNLSDWLEKQLEKY